jgi:hypothetical protein
MKEASVMLKTGAISLIFFGSLLLFQTNWKDFSSTKENESEQVLIVEDAFDIDILVQKKDVKINLRNHETVIDSKSDELLLSIFQKATKISGIVNMRPQDYEITVIKNDRVDKIYYLWIKKDTKQANLMDHSDTHTAYKLSSETTEQLKQILINRGLPPS